MSFSDEQPVQVKVTRTALGKRWGLPCYATSLSSGLDLTAACEAATDIAPGERALVPTGISIALPANLEAQVRPRSGLALKKGLTVLNTPGTIDADYRGEIKVILVNLGQDSVTVEPGDRIAQLVVAPVLRVRLEEVNDLPAAARGDGGFGSTGYGRISDATQ